jgi:diguanylate cyclase (GGDEF)-like protein
LDVVLTRRARAARHGIRDWPLWELPRWLTGLVITVTALYGVALVAAGMLMRFQTSDAGLFAALLGFGVIAIELTRRTGEPAGFQRDVHGIWLLPMAILLPPFYCILAPLPKVALMQLRIRKYVVHRRIYSAAVHGLAYGAASVLYHALEPHLAALSANPPSAWLERAAVITGCVVVRLAVNRLLIMIPVKGSDPTVTLRSQMLNGDQFYHDLSELTAGIVLTILLAATRSWLLVFFALPLVTSLQRSLRHAQLVDAARVDAKTGLLNAAAWQRESRVEITRAARTRTPLAVAMLDIDHFKQVNDTYGHLTGDAVLAALSAALRGLLREYDISGRFGGEEFAILLPHTDAASAGQIAERLRARLAQISVPISGPGNDPSPLQVTVSIGVATLAHSRRDLEELLAAADAALYRAKGAGRNRVVLLSEDEYTVAAASGGASGMAADRAADSYGAPT